MTKIMNASESMTDGQIETTVNQLRDAMRKHRSEIGRESAQLALGTDNLGMRMFAIFRDIAEKQSKLIIRHVAVDRTRTPEQVINATGRVKWYINEQVLAEMPRDGFPEGEVEFFELDYDPTVNELDREYEARNLKPDPYALAQVMIDDPAFADERLVAVQWRDKNKYACYVIFDRDGDRRKVYVVRFDCRWGRHYLFAGVRK